jgi:hypothetical protein
MTNWIAPDVTRRSAPLVADERVMLDGWLDWHRARPRSALSAERDREIAVRPAVGREGGTGGHHSMGPSLSSVTSPW